MPEQRRTTRIIAAEARAWFAKLSNPVVSNKDIWAWADWIRDPANRVAYNRIEARSRRAPDECLFTETEILEALKRRPDLARVYRAAFKRAERPSALPDIARELAARIAP